MTGPATRPDRLVSVVMPTYREAPRALGRAIDSILAQTHRELELIVVLDDPEDREALACLRRAAARDARVRVLVNARNLGPWGSYARGLRAVRGAFVAIHDADDESMPDRLERQLAYLDSHPEVDVVGTALEYVEEATGRPLMLRRYPEDVGGAIRRYSPLAHPTTLRRAGLDETYGTYRRSRAVRWTADYDLWCRWFEAGVRMANIPDAAYRYYQSGANIKSRHARAVLRETVQLKMRHARALRLGPGDWCVLWAEAAALLLPVRAAMAAFYVVNRRRSLRVASADPAVDSADTAPRAG